MKLKELEKLVQECEQPELIKLEIPPLRPLEIRPLPPLDMSFTKNLEKMDKEWERAEISAHIQKDLNSLEAINKKIDQHLANFIWEQRQRDNPYGISDDLFRQIREIPNTCNAYKKPEPYVEPPFQSTKEQQLQFRDTARIRKAARGLAQLHRMHSIFREVPKELCAEIIAQCSDGSFNKKQATELANEFFDKPKLAPYPHEQNES